MLIRHELQGINEALEMCSGDKARLGKQRGLKRLAEGAKNQASSYVRETYQIKKSDVDSKFDVQATSEQAVITAKSRPINLTYFNAKQLGARHGKRVIVRRKDSKVVATVRGKAGTFTGVMVGITKSKTTLIPGAFIAQMPNGMIGVFRRESRPMRGDYRSKRQFREKRTSRAYSTANRPVTKPRQAIANMAVKTVSSLFTGANVMPRVRDWINDNAARIVGGEIRYAMTGKR